MRPNRQAAATIIAVTIAIGDFLSGLAWATDEMDLATLTAAVRSQLTSIASIDVKYQHVGEPSNGARWTEESEWAEQGTLRLFSSTYRGDSGRPAYLTAFDGEKGYDYTWDPAGERAARLVIRRETNSGYWDAQPPYFFGRRVIRGGPGLVELMESAQAKITGAEDFQGHRCWRVAVPGVKLRAVVIDVEVLLDPDHDFLPARIDSRSGPAQAANAAPQHANKTRTTYVIDDFALFTDTATESERWFPRHVTLEGRAGPDLLAKHEFTVASVVLNSAIAVDHFRPHIDENTAVHDLTVEGPSKSYISGGNRAADALVQRAARDALEKLSAQGEKSQLPFGIDARPRRSVWPAYAMFSGSLVACAIAFVFWFRSKS